MTGRGNRGPRRDEAVRLREEEGLSFGAIAKRLGVKPATVACWCVLDGAEPPGQPRIANRRSPPGRDQENTLIQSMEGKPLTVIARTIDRSVTCVRYRIAAMERDAIRAEACE